MLNIPIELTFEAFENALRDVKRSHIARLPVHFKHVGIWGIEATATQLLATWASAHSQPIIKTFINDNDATDRANQLAQLGRRLYGIAGLYLTTGLTTTQDSPIPRKEYLSACLPVLNAMNSAILHLPLSVAETYPRSGDKVAVQFLCLHGTRYEFHESLYSEPNRMGLRKRTGFEKLIRSALGRNRIFSTFQSEQSSDIESLAKIVYELFQNTNDHGYLDLDDIPVRKNIRSLLIKEHNGRSDSGHISRMQSTNPRFNSYLTFCKDKFSKGENTTHYYLELSIFDGGIGYAQRFKKLPLQSMSLQEERLATVDCFKSGVTTSRSQSRGEGLNAVWQTLCALKGFLRIRTGRMSLFQVFHDQIDPATCSLENWTEGPLEQVTGTAITIIIPCKLDHERRS